MVPHKNCISIEVDYTLWIDGFEKKQIDSTGGSVFPLKAPKPFEFTVGVRSCFYFLSGSWLFTSDWKLRNSLWR